MSALPLSDQGWVGRAACLDADPATWFPTPGNVADTRSAKAICAGCPVREACLTWALDHDEDVGIWGGLTETERAQLRRRNRRRSA